MSPRNSLLISLLILILSGTATAGEPPGLIKFYQARISAIDGDRCPMNPSCSEYAAQAIAKHGVVIGWIMACDRLMRCGRDEKHLSPKIEKNGAVLIHDPVSANDFWWFKKNETR